MKGAYLLLCCLALVGVAHAQLAFLLTELVGTKGRINIIEQGMLAARASITSLTEDLNSLKTQLTTGTETHLISLETQLSKKWDQPEGEEALKEVSSKVNSLLGRFAEWTTQIQALEKNVSMVQQVMNSAQSERIPQHIQSKFVALDSAVEDLRSLSNSTTSEIEKIKNLLEARSKETTGEFKELRKSITDLQEVIKPLPNVTRLAESLKTNETSRQLAVERNARDLRGLTKDVAELRDDVQEDLKDTRTDFRDSVNGVRDTLNTFSKYTSNELLILAKDVANVTATIIQLTKDVNKLEREIEYVEINEEGLNRGLERSASELQKLALAVAERSTSIEERVDELSESLKKTTAEGSEQFAKVAADLTILKQGMRLVSTAVPLLLKSSKKADYVEVNAEHRNRAAERNAVDISQLNDDIKNSISSLSASFQEDLKHIRTDLGLETVERQKKLNETQWTIEENLRQELNRTNERLVATVKNIVASQGILEEQFRKELNRTDKAVAANANATATKLLQIQKSLRDDISQLSLQVNASVLQGQESSQQILARVSDVVNVTESKIEALSRAAEERLVVFRDTTDQSLNLLQAHINDSIIETRKDTDARLAANTDKIYENITSLERATVKSMSELSAALENSIAEVEAGVAVKLATNTNLMSENLTELERRTERNISRLSLNVNTDIAKVRADTASDVETRTSLLKQKIETLARTTDENTTALEAKFGKRIDNTALQVDSKLKVVSRSVSDLKKSTQGDVRRVSAESEAADQKIIAQAQSDKEALLTQIKTDQAAIAELKAQVDKILKGEAASPGLAKVLTFSGFGAAVYLMV